jgi:hypothetical protein
MELPMDAPVKKTRGRKKAVPMPETAPATPAEETEVESEHHDS